MSTPRCHSKQVFRGVYLATSLLAGGALFAPQARAESTEPHATPRSHGFFLSDEDRYQPRTNFLRAFGEVFLRAGTDFVAIPSSMVATWSKDDYAKLFVVTGVVAGLMSETPSPDAQLQNWLHRHWGRAGERFTLWTKLGDALIWVSIWSPLLLTLTVGWLSNQPAMVEVVSLAVEAFLVAQVFQWVPKLLLGREGPMNGDGQGKIWGPSHSIELFPAGTPSGHAATLYAMMGVVAAYVDRTWVTVALQAFGAVICGTLFVDDYHFVSDLIWGAAMGWEVGGWVVNHRSQRAAALSVGRGRFQVLPLVSPRSGTFALSAAVTFD